jgi:hypothetical protein
MRQEALFFITRTTMTGHRARDAQYSCGFVGCHLRRKVFEFAVSHEPHNPKVDGSNPPPATNSINYLAGIHRFHLGQIRSWKSGKSELPFFWARLGRTCSPSCCSASFIR